MENIRNPSENHQKAYMVETIGEKIKEKSLTTHRAMDENLGRRRIPSLRAAEAGG